MATTHDELLRYYATPGVFTGVAGFENQVDGIGDDVASIVRVVQGLLLHRAWAPAYGVTLATARQAEAELHGTEAMLSVATRLDDGPLCEARPPERRVAVVCRHFATMFVAFMRHKGVPARVRAGFATYFERGKHVEHWVGEYWSAEQRRWVMVDAQVDEVQRAIALPDFDTLDVPRDRFLVAGDAWRACRSGADAMTFGVGGTEMWGLVEVYGEVFQDVAALQKIELSPWGWYGLAKDHEGMEKETALVDELAALSSAGDAAALDRLRAMIAGDARLGVPAEMLEKMGATDRASMAA